MWDIPVYKRILLENNWITPPLHPALYPLYENSTPTCNNVVSRRQRLLYLQQKYCKYKEKDVFIKLQGNRKTIQQQTKRGFKKIDTILQNQMNLDEKHITIAPHLKKWTFCAITR